LRPKFSTNAYYKYLEWRNLLGFDCENEIWTIYNNRNNKKKFKNVKIFDNKAFLPEKLTSKGAPRSIICFSILIKNRKHLCDMHSFLWICYQKQRSPVKNCDKFSKNLEWIMEYKYTVLKTSWGVSITLNMEELINPQIMDSDIPVSTGIFLRIADSVEFSRSTIEVWIVNGIKSMVKEISAKRCGVSICFNLLSIITNYIDYQDEGLYCAAQGWLSKYYNFDFKPIHVVYNTALNRYDFEIPPFD